MRELLDLSELAQKYYPEDNYKTMVIGTSDCNEYIPVFAINCHKLITFKGSSEKVMEYSMPIFEIPGYNYVRTYEDLIHRVRSSTIPNKYIFKLSNENYNVNVHTGIVYDNEGNILMCLAINKDYLFSVSMDVLKTNPDCRQFVIFISNLLDNPIYKNIKKKLHMLYIDKAKQIGLDIVTTNRVNSWIFKNNVKPLKFKTVMKMHKYLKEEVPKRILDII